METLEIHFVVSHSYKYNKKKYAEIKLLDYK